MPTHFPEEQALRELASVFEETFHSEPDFLVRSPGRVDLIGTHTDYNEGWVLPAAINRSAWLAVKALPTPLVTVHAVDMEEQVAFRLTDLDAHKTLAGQDLPEWARFPAGVAWSLQEAGLATPGSQIALSGNIPIGAGLSSSAAVEVAYGLAWSHIVGWKVDKMALAQYCQRAENLYVGVNSGLMDQFACLFGQAGHALLFDCRTLEWEAVPLSNDVTLIIADTGTRRTLSTSHYNERRADCDAALEALKPHLPDIKALRDVSPDQLETHKDAVPEQPYRRAAHIIAENERVRAAAAALKNGDTAGLGKLMDESYISTRDLFDASGPQLDAMWEASQGHPARLGGRPVGAGWAGCMVFLAKTEGCDAFIEHLEQRYQAEVAIEPTIHRVETADGAQVVEVN
ncbi:MAG: galactokinase [Anaerolineae bacterium]|nr:galactokinase [Anaerolineae bacterium]